MKKLIIISNKISVQILKDKNGIHSEMTDDADRSGLQQFHKKHNTCWVGHPEITFKNITEQDKEEITKQLTSLKYIPLFSDTDTYAQYFNGYSQKVLWPVFHYFPQNADFQNQYWEDYIKINRDFADLISEIYSEGDILWINDHNLLMLPYFLRDRLPNAPIGLFIHIPFPSFEIFRILPQRTEILGGMLCADLVGFHTYDYVSHFLSCVKRLMGFDTFFNQVKLGERILKVDTFPKGIDYSRFHKKKVKNKSKLTSFQRDLQAFKSSNDPGILILSVDWMDYTKGITHKLSALELFLQKNPKYIEKITLIIITSPQDNNSHINEELKKETDEIVGRINGTFGTINWMPVWYFNQQLEQQELIDLYAACDIALIAPLRDGLNLIAKEYIAAQTDGNGILILSEMAGASKELFEALVVNPNDLEDIAMTIKEALEMDDKEKARRIKVMQERLERYDIKRWAVEFLNGLKSIKSIQETTLTKKITDKNIVNIKKLYKTAKSRILFLDYDGTLTRFYKNPEDAKPDDQLYDLLKKLTKDKKNKVVIISGRDKETLSRWFDMTWNIELVAEHGVWYRDPGHDWYMTEKIDNEWKKSVRPLLEYYVDQTPNSFIENKNFSLAWHYRKVDIDLGQQRAWELKDELLNLTTNLNLEIMDGDKVLEIKYSGINKGRAAGIKLSDSTYNFILAIGDDWTDEYTFEAMPEQAYTIKVGTKATKANFYIDSVDTVRELIKILVD